MKDKTHQSNPHRLPKLKQFVRYGDQLINLLTVTAFKYFYSDPYDKWYLGYYTNTGSWTTLDSSVDQDVIIEKFKALQNELLK